MESELFNRLEEEPALVGSTAQTAEARWEEEASSNLHLELITQALVRQILDPALQKANLTGLKAQLLILEGQYLLHYRAKSGAGISAEKFKFISPLSVRLAFSNSPIDSGWFGAGICRWGAVREGNWLVKFLPPRDDYQLQLKLPEPQDHPGTHTTTTATSVIQIALPGLIFVGIGQHYYLWAIKEAEFRPQAHLYAAPLPNLYQDGRICWGQNLPPPASAQTIEAAWHLFISSEFTDHLVQGKSKAFPEDVRHRLLTLGKANNPAPAEGNPSGTKKKGRSKGGRSYPLGDLVGYTEGWGNGATPATVARAVDQLLARHG